MENYAKVSNALWKILKSHINSPSNWEGVAREIDQAVMPCKGTEAEKYATEYAVIVLNELKRRADERKRKMMIALNGGR